MLSVLITFLTIVYVIVCVILVLVVLMQEGKSGGLAGSETASQSPGALTDTFGAGGAQKTLFNTTAYLAAAFLVIALGLTLLGNSASRSGGHLELDTAPAATTNPVSSTGTSTTVDPSAPAAVATPTT